MQLIDSHCHLDASEFDADRQNVITQARAAGVTRQIIPAVAASGWPKLRDLCSSHKGLFPAYGLHPMFLEQHKPLHLHELRNWIQYEQPVAIGECGLDFFVPHLDHGLQFTYFEEQLKLAREFDLPIIIHARRAVEAVIVAIRKIGGLRGVVHSYSGSEEQARQLWENGFMIGLGGPITYSRAQRLHRLAATMPLEYLLLETDAPDQPDADHRGQRNTPAHLTLICNTIAKLRNQPPAVIAQITWENASRLFGLPA